MKISIKKFYIKNFIIFLSTIFIIGSSLFFIWKTKSLKHKYIEPFYTFNTFNVEVNPLNTTTSAALVPRAGGDGDAASPTPVAAAPTPTVTAPPTIAAGAPTSQAPIVQSQPLLLLQPPTEQAPTTTTTPLKDIENKAMCELHKRFGNCRVNYWIHRCATTCAE